MNKTVFVIAAFALVLGCQKQEKAAEAHEHGGIAVTHYTEATELFVEFPALVKDDEASFAAHLTRLADWKPVAQGTLEVVLSGGGAPEERASSEVSDTPGIFRPAIAPQHAGKRRLAFHLVAPGVKVTHDVGEVEVHQDHDATHAAAEEPEGVKYTKEQQWQVPFRAITAEARTVRDSIQVNAMLRPRADREAQLAAPVAGLLRSGPAGFPQIGARVAAGQVLGYVVPRLGGGSDHAALELAVRRARIELDQARQERERLEELFKVEAVPQKRVLEARARESVAVAEAGAAEQRLSGYGGAGGGIALKSPIAGTVVAVSGGPGSPVADGQVIVHIAELSRLWLEARVPETEVARIRSPQGAFFTVNDQTIVLETGKNARLVAFGGMVDAETRTVPAILEFANPGGRLHAGMRLRAALYTGRVDKGIAVPASALIDEGAQTVLYVQKGGELFERRVVMPGPRDGDWVAIPQGLQPGERVVSEGAHQVRLAASAPAAAGHGHAH